MEFYCKDFKVGKCQGQKVVDGETMARVLQPSPRVLQPSEPDKGDIELLFQALERNKDWFEEMITKNSAVLLRGFHVKKAEDFNDIVETCGWDDIRYGKGTRDGYGMAAQWRMWFNTKVGMHGKELSSAMMADGTEIPEKFVKRCEQIIEEESIRFKWEAGDVLFLDNYALLHGRRPSLPPRKVPVATCK
ncbi:hypothetical protein GH714_041042 [Hevea brasiliensis]|uniref:TauD/TfdA-like domain-containing protein n=1 Tax=Hevea brasiliensis TaxID=3981 RepID=A0A6A6NA62_HEVBR|nr:hypothetical protein GH714_041042 [Hevea brasiliensis]